MVRGVEKSFLGQSMYRALLSLTFFFVRVPLLIYWNEHNIGSRSFQSIKHLSETENHFQRRIDVQLVNRSMTFFFLSFIVFSVERPVARMEHFPYLLLLKRWHFR